MGKQIVIVNKIKCLLKIRTKELEEYKVGSNWGIDLKDIENREILISVLHNRASFHRVRDEIDDLNNLLGDDNNG